MAASDPQSLLAEAACFQCFAANGYSLDLIEVSLWAQIVEAGSGGGHGILGEGGEPIEGEGGGNIIEE